MTSSYILFLVILLIVAFLYSSVGHGGASGYLALMALFSFSPEVMKPTALVLNIFVSLIAFIHYYRGGYFKLKIFLPLALASIPFAFLGGLTVVNDHVYKQILGFLLIIPIIRFAVFGLIAKEEMKQRPSNIILSVFIGAVIGYTSGMIGIGGGIILSPVLLFLGWTDLKQTAAISAAFILVNSVSGLSGLITKGISFSPEMLVMIVIAFTGGLAGSYFGAKQFNNKILSLLLSLVLLIAAYKLITT